MRFLLLISVLLVSSDLFAQLSRKEKKAARRNTAVDQPTTLEPASSMPDYSDNHAKHSKSKKKKGTGPTYNSQKEFQDRMDARGKTYRKNEKNMSTEQYTNPAFFGHKRPPKKRPANKMKLCKVCGIRH
ncbi:MAG TPA: hypothetical protein VK589_03920 [Chryseolinea sp.]|nr:hypothetical protein [Chryseolinea sp.]